MYCQVNVQPQTITISKHNCVTGHISITIREITFPENNWDDFIVTILGWWLTSTIEVISGKESKGYCYFMDGPYKFEIEASSKDVWKCRFLERGSLENEKCILEEFIEPQPLLDSLLDSSSVVINLCHEKGWISKELNLLENQYSKLKSLIKRNWS
jgi:hypothetical protein